jgi:hypothetical protein
MIKGLRNIVNKRKNNAMPSHVVANSESDQQSFKSNRNASQHGKSSLGLGRCISKISNDDSIARQLKFPEISTGSTSGF